MTGRYPHELGIWTNPPHFRGKYPRVKTMAMRFKENGYRAVGIGKIYHNWAQVLEGDEMSWSEPQVYHWGAHYYDWYIPGRPYEMHRDIKKGNAVQSMDVPDEAYVDGRIANAAVNKLRELQETPFFLAVGFWKPHLPYNAPKKYWDLYDRDNLPSVRYNEPVKGVPEMVYVNSNEARSYRDVDRNAKISEAQKAELRHGYFASITYLDAQLGKVINELEKLGLDKNTIIVFLSDHGYHAGEHGQFGKWTNFEIGTRVPFIIISPDDPYPGKTTNSIVELVDIYPTLLDMCKISKGEIDGLSGTSLYPVIRDPEVSIKEYAVSQITRPLGAGADFSVIGSSIRVDNFRYNMWTNRNDNSLIAEELYDLSDDLHKVQNLARNPEYSELCDELQDKLVKTIEK